MGIKSVSKALLYVYKKTPIDKFILPNYGSYFSIFIE